MHCTTVDLLTGSGLKLKLKQEIQSQAETGLLNHWAHMCYQSWDVLLYPSSILPASSHPIISPAVIATII